MAKYLGQSKVPYCTTAGGSAVRKRSRRFFSRRAPLSVAGRARSPAKKKPCPLGSSPERCGVAPGTFGSRKGRGRTSAPGTGIAQDGREESPGTAVHGFPCSRQLETATYADTLFGTLSPIWINPVYRIPGAVSTRTYAGILFRQGVDESEGPVSKEEACAAVVGDTVKELVMQFLACPKVRIFIDIHSTVSYNYSERSVIQTISSYAL